VIVSLRNLQRRTLVLVTLLVAIAVVILVVLERGTAAAPDHSVYLPLVFKADTVVLPGGQVSTQQFQQGDIFTTACLEVVERVYPQDRWWEAANLDSKSPESAFKAVVWALRHRDRAALLKALDPKEAQGDPHLKLNGRPVGPIELAEMVFEQFETLELVAVPRAYEFDDLVMFVARVRAKQAEQPDSPVLPFVFAREADGSFGLLPTRSEKLTYQIVQDWFTFYKNWGGPGNSEPKYCAAETVKRATHKISLYCTMGAGRTTSSSCSADEKVWNRSQLFLTGVRFDAPGGRAALVNQIELTIDKMKSAMAADNIDEFAKYMDAGGAKKAKQWFASADETARSKYKAAIAKIEPFFLFDASPLVVVYTKPLDGDIRYIYTGNGVMYFTPTANNEWVWTNASLITDMDKVFTVGPLYQGALLRKPFSNLEIK